MGVGSLTLSPIGDQTSSNVDSSKIESAGDRLLCREVSGDTRRRYQALREVTVEDSAKGKLHHRIVSTTTDVVTGYA